MNNRLRTVLVLSLAVACALAVTASAGARTTHSELRVEAVGQTLDPGTNYSNASITTRNSRACGPTNSRRERLRGANAMGLVAHASKVSGRLRAFRTSDTFDFGLIVCEIGNFQGFGDRAWLYRVNHASPSIGADQQRVGRGDEVLWYYANFSTGRNTGDALELRGVPVSVRPGRSFQVRAFAYDLGGNPAPAGGVRVAGAAQPTAPNGTTTVTARSTPGTMGIRGRRGSDIASEPLAICVQRNLARCPDRRGERFVGTGGADDLRAGAGPDVMLPHDGRDLVNAGAGDDRVDVQGGGRDRVNCGPGRDQVAADREDRVRANCEAV
jgi:hypothetical protein